MERKDRIDTWGVMALLGFSTLLAVNQVVIKLGTSGLQPIFMAGLRSFIALGVLSVWMRVRGIAVTFPKGTILPGLGMGCLFAFEFICLFWALDHTTVARASILFYTMPVVLAIAAHVLLPQERLTRSRVIGLALAMMGVVFVLLRRTGGEASFAGDMAALAGAMGWAGIALCVRLTPLSRVPPEMQLLWQLAVSSVILLAVAPLFGPLMRDPTVWHWAGLGFQALAVASFGYLFWFFLMTIYPASGVASFSFLSPVLSVFFGWLILSEPLGWNMLAGVVFVAVGLVLINRKPKIG